MAALLEALLRKKVDANEAVEWLKGGGDADRLAWCQLLTIERQEFVPYLLNFLREQSSSALTHGPATPAKTPNHPRASLHFQQGRGFSSERRGGCRSAGPGTGPRSASRVQLFSPTPSGSPGVELDMSQTHSESLCFPGASSSESIIPGNSFSSYVRSPVLASTFRASPSERRSAQRVSLGDFMLSPTELQQHHHSPSMGANQQQRGRKRMGMSGQGRQGGARGGTEEAGPARVDVGCRKGRGGGANMMAEPALSPPMACSPAPVHLNFNNLDDFPPMQAAYTSPPQQTKPSRRINPTPVSAERPHSRAKTCFTSTPFSTRPSSSPPLSDALSGGIGEGVPTVQNQNLGSPPLSLQEERVLLKKEKCKRANQMSSSQVSSLSSPLLSSLDPCTPTKAGGGLGSGSNFSPDTQGSFPDPSKVTMACELDLLADLYCTCISENLVPNVFLELFFVLQLLTSRTRAVPEDEDLSMIKSDVLERGYLNKVHNCVYFSVSVLDNQFELVSHLDKDTLRLLAENERVSSFSPPLRERLALAQNSSTAKVSASVDTFVHSVPFQPATDNRSNFSSDKAFHTFKKQRDIFYEVLREWEDYHKEPGWEFEAVLGSRVRGVVSQLNSAGNHSHFARLFLKQLIQMCKGPRALGSLSDAPDADLLGMLGADSLGRLKRLEERFIQPQGILGPCPPPSFPGHQEFFRDFLKTASCCQLNQHLKDRLCQQLLQLDEVSILAPVVSSEEGEEERDMEQQDEKQRFSSVLLLARLLAKFLGYISFLPYQMPERPSREIQEANVALRFKSSSVLDVCAVLRSCVVRRRTVLTVPWLVEFLSMLDYTGPFLLCYQTALGLLLSLYRRMALSKGGEVCYLNQLLLVAVLGWLFQIPVIPEELFFSNDFNIDAELEESPTNAQGLDCLPLVDQQLLYTCCPFFGEFRKLLAAFVAGCSARGGGLIRKITPTSAELRGVPISTMSQQKLQVDLEQAFFHNQPPSLKRTVEFVAERVGSNCVKHIKATLVCELVRGGEKLLREGLTSPGASPLKLCDSICVQLCDAGQLSLEKATRFCDEKGPEAIRVLLPNDTSPAVLTTSENITRRLATEKACGWLASNITALIKREWKTMCDRVMKSFTAEGGDVDGIRAGTGVGTQERPKMKTKDAVTSCPCDCTHSAPLASDVLVEIKEVLSIAVGPRSEEEGLTVLQLKTLLERVEGTLRCKKFSLPKPEQMLISCTVLLACRLVSGEVPVFSLEQCSRSQSPGSGAVRSLLEQMVVLWGRPFVSAPPLHLLFTEITLTGVLGASDSEESNFLFLVTQLVERGVLGEVEVVSNWEKLSRLPWPMEFSERIQQCSSITTSSLPSLQKQMDMLQISHQPAEGAN